MWSSVPYVVGLFLFSCATVLTVIDDEEPDAGQFFVNVQFDNILEKCLLDTGLVLEKSEAQTSAPFWREASDQPKSVSRSGH